MSDLRTAARDAGLPPWIGDGPGKGFVALDGDSGDLRVFVWGCDEDEQPGHFSAAGQFGLAVADSLLQFHIADRRIQPYSRWVAPDGRSLRDVIDHLAPELRDITIDDYEDFCR